MEKKLVTVDIQELWDLSTRLSCLHDAMSLTAEAMEADENSSGEPSKNALTYRV